MRIREYSKAGLSVSCPRSFTASGCSWDSGLRMKMSGCVFDVEDSPRAEQFFKNYKETLKHRFRQLDIWIVSFEIRVT